MNNIKCQMLDHAPQGNGSQLKVFGIGEFFKCKFGMLDIYSFHYNLAERIR